MGSKLDRSKSWLLGEPKLSCNDTVDSVDEQAVFAPVEMVKSLNLVAQYL